uniref:Uncharacterized protein n=1 Tax=Cuerna arida TaxID=1464854 RepID=A0A1B6F3H6_9HEMI
MAENEDKKAFCVLDYHIYQSVVSVQRHFRTRFNEDPPSNHSIFKWYSNFKRNGCICKKKSTGRPSVSNEVVEQVRESFMRSPQKSTVKCSRELGVPQPTVWKILRKRLKFKPYKLQLLQALKENDKVKRLNFCESMQGLMKDEDFVKHFVFSDEATFHLCGKVNRQNVRIWGSENQHVYIVWVRDSPKVNVFCAITYNNVYGPFFFMEQTINGMIFLDVMTEWLLPQLEQDLPNFILQLDGAPPHYHLEVRTELNNQLPQRWIGRAGPNDDALLTWPPRSPDITPCDYFLW